MYIGNRSVDTPFIYMSVNLQPLLPSTYDWKINMRRALNRPDEFKQAWDQAYFLDDVVQS